MIRFVLKRTLLLIPVLLGVLLIIFVINSISGDPIVMLLPVDATEAQKEVLREELGLDRPFVVQFADYVWGVVTRFDLGTSYFNNRPVADEVLDRYPISLEFALLSVCISILIGVPLGIISAIKQNSPLDYTSTLLSLLFASMPHFWLGLMLILIFSLHLGWFPASGLGTWRHWVLPSLALGLTPIASICRTTRSNMLEVIRQDYIRTARAKGLSERSVIWKHALKNALIPVVTVIGMQVGVIIGGSVVVESVFSIPGIGTLIRNGVNNKDFPSIMGSLVVHSLTIGVLNLIVDVFYGFIDPRIKAQYMGSKFKMKRSKAKDLVAK